MQMIKKEAKAFWYLCSCLFRFFLLQEEEKKMVPMTYEEIEEAVLKAPRFKAIPSVENMKQYLEYFGHPERSFSVIHVAGTNGKGSTCSFLESILRRAGIRTGLFTSPHLVSMRERIQIDREWADPSLFVEAYWRIK